MIYIYIYIYFFLTTIFMNQQMVNKTSHKKPWNSIGPGLLSVAAFSRAWAAAAAVAPVAAGNSNPWPRPKRRWWKMVIDRGKTDQKEIKTTYNDVKISIFFNWFQMWIVCQRNHVFGCSWRSFPQRNIEDWFPIHHGVWVQLRVTNLYKDHNLWK